MIKEFLHYRELLYMLTWKEIKIRYKQSVMGFLWAIFMPALIVGAGILMKLGFSFSNGSHLTVTDVVSVAAKGVAWAFFAGAVRFGANSLIANHNLLTKIYFPREILPIANVLANFFDFVIAALFVTVVMAIVGAGASIQLLWLPLIVLVLVMISASFALLLSCANLFFRDVKYIIEVVLTYGILFTPVFYSAKMFGKWGPLLLLNPVGAALEAINDVVVLHRSPDPLWLGYATLFAVFGLIVSWTIFEKTEPLFAQEI
jgi:lipopolysaccharide transport system permease protein